LTNCDVASVAPNATIKLLVIIGSIIVGIGLFFWHHLRKLKAEEKQESEGKQKNYAEMKDQSEVNRMISILSGDFINLDIAFRNVGLVLDDGKAILNEVNGEFKGSSLTAIMGPSGCGKSVRTTTILLFKVD
jgi:ABC-type transport system involved in Fe-S cluster assembly fused permease/ATPase subunit